MRKTDGKSRPEGRGSRKAGRSRKVKKAGRSGKVRKARRSRKAKKAGRNRKVKKFASVDHAGPKDVADFLGLEDDEDVELIKRDAYEQVQALLNLV